MGLRLPPGGRKISSGKPVKPFFEDGLFGFHLAAPSRITKIQFAFIRSNAFFRNIEHVDWYALF